MNTRKNRGKRFKTENDVYVADFEEGSVSSQNDPDEQEEARKSRIRDSNKEFARRMTILQSWSEFWEDYTTREGEAYPQKEARDMIKRTKKISCPIPSCGKTFTSVGGLKYHYARCNIERSFKCKVCSPPMQMSTRGELLRHMIQSHHEDLPELNDDQKEIVRGYLDYQTRSEKSVKDKKVVTSVEQQCYGQRAVKLFSDLRNKLFSPSSFSQRPYRDWQSYVKDWEIVYQEIDRAKYYPPESESVNFKLETKEEWKKIKIGEYEILNTDKHGSPASLLFFTGGTNTATAWLPKSVCDNDSKSADLVAIAVNCCPMDVSQTYRESNTGHGCIQFWSVEHSSSETKVQLNYMVGHNYGTIFDLIWCPLGASWQPPVNTGDVLSRLGLLALACGDGLIRILSVPHTQTLLSRPITRVVPDIIHASHIFRVKPVATLTPPNLVQPADQQTNACKSICWNLEDNQRLIVAGYANGHVALYDLANYSPLLYTNVENRHIYRPIKCWLAHGAPVTGVAACSPTLDQTLIATGSFDRQLKIWNPMDLDSVFATDRAPITKILWDYRMRGVVAATDAAFTSFNNRVSYRYPVVDGSHSVTVTVHRSTVWGLSNSVITNSMATSDGAGEVFVAPQLIFKTSHRRDRNLIGAHSLFTMLPRALTDRRRESVIRFPATETSTATAASMLTELKAGGDSYGGRKNNNNDNPTNMNGSPEENYLDADADFSVVERNVANKPTKFLLPIEHRPVETYTDFKINFGLEFVHYDCTTIKQNSKAPESCLRACDAKNIYCDRPCDYPFSSINLLAWSPNTNTYQFLLSGTQVGLCRLDRVHVVEQMYKAHVEALDTTANAPSASLAVGTPATANKPTDRQARQRQ